MSIYKLEGKYFSNYFLMFICLTFCLSACINISGEVTCDKCESGNITVIAYDAGFNVIADKKLDGCGPYSLIIPTSYVGEMVYVFALCDEDSSGEFSPGDYFGDPGSLESNPYLNFIYLQTTNEGINITIDREITASIEGEVSCDVYDSGLVSVGVFEEFPPTSPPSSTTNFFPLNGEKKGYYKIFLFDIPLGSEIWVSGMWDVDGNFRTTPCDYMGLFPENPITLEEEVLTGIDFNGCELQVSPCSG